MPREHCLCPSIKLLACASKDEERVVRRRIEDRINDMGEGCVVDHAPVKGQIGHHLLSALQSSLLTARYRGAGVFELRHFDGAAMRADD
jgi:putative component of toxin-antitoxin plasmid stabilization module